MPWWHTAAASKARISILKHSIHSMARAATYDTCGDLYLFALITGRIGVISLSMYLFALRS